jgi:hypothetical protein
VPTIANRDLFGMTHRAKAKRGLGGNLSIDLDQRGDRGKMGLITCRGESLLEEDLKRGIGISRERFRQEKESKKSFSEHRSSFASTCLTENLTTF